MSKLDQAAVSAFLEEVAPGITNWFTIEQVGDRTARLRMPHNESNLRPGGIVSGPTLMMLADTAVWVALLAEVGPEAMTTTVNLNIHFLRQGAPAAVVAETRLHKVGKRLATGDVLMYTEGDPEPIAHATVTYAIPRTAS